MLGGANSVSAPRFSPLQDIVACRDLASFSKVSSCNDDTTVKYFCGKGPRPWPKICYKEQSNK